MSNSGFMRTSTCEIVRDRHGNEKVETAKETVFPKKVNASGVCP